MQRFFDILLSAAAIILMLPALLPIALLLRLTGEGEVFYKQTRIGRNGKPFGVLKFATMLKDSPSMGTGSLTIQDDPRILPAGKFLRKTKINELPQLLNVLAGQMSLIGPRPMTPRQFGAYPEEHQAVISRLRPGLSGIGSIIFRSEEEMTRDLNDPVRFYDEVIAPYKGKLEVWFSTRQGIRTYFLLIFMTVWVVVNSRSNLVWRLFPDLPAPPEALALRLKP